MSKMLDLLREGNDKHDVELQKEKDEVARLKKEIEDLKKEHESAIQELTAGSVAEIENEKKEHERQRAQAVAEVEERLNAELGRQKAMFDSIEKTNQLLKEQNELMEAKMVGWRKIADALDRDMEGKSKPVCRHTLFFSFS